MAEEVKDETLTVEEPTEGRREEGQPSQQPRESAPSPASASAAPRERIPSDPASPRKETGSKKKEVKIKIFMLDGTDVVFDFEVSVNHSSILAQCELVKDVAFLILHFL